MFVVTTETIKILFDCKEIMDGLSVEMKVDEKIDTACALIDNRKEKHSKNSSLR